MNPMAELDAVTSLRAGIVDGPAEDKVEGICFADRDKETGGRPVKRGEGQPYSKTKPSAKAKPKTKAKLETVAPL